LLCFCAFFLVFLRPPIPSSHSCFAPRTEEVVCVLFFVFLIFLLFFYSLFTQSSNFSWRRWD
jgi:hypothetical protein